MRRYTLRYKKKSRQIGCVILLFTLVAAITAGWLYWYFSPMDEEELKKTDTTVIAETYYVVSADKKDIFAFSTMRDDTLMNDIVPSEKQLQVKCREYINAQWVRKYKYLPYCGGTLAVEEFDTAKVCRYSKEQIMALLQQEAEHIKYLQHLAKAQKKDIDYFTQTHTVTDNGFDIVALYGEELLKATDSVNIAADAVTKALKGKRLDIRLKRRYYINSYKGLIECVPVKAGKGVLTLRTNPTAAQEDVELEDLTTSIYAHSRLSAEKAIAQLKTRKPKHKKLYLAPIDSIGTYTGPRDSVAEPHGYGRFVSMNGEFYEGEWKHGKREGVGFCMLPGKGLKLGEWKADRFLGERITYTPERIYGIDISRFQHEDGRKRYNIDWKNLRITSLGTISKKKINGSVDYPIHFIYIKATEGTTVKNKYFHTDYVASRRHGYRTGAYHFFSLRTTGSQQAAFFLKNSRYNKGDLPPVLDVEPTDAQIKKAGGIEKIFKNVRSWLYAVERSRGVKPILYISQTFVNKYLSKAPDLKKNYDVWIARYGEYKPDVHLVYWQLCPDGRVKGIHGAVDINVYNGFNF